MSKDHEATKELKTLFVAELETVTGGAYRPFYPGCAGVGWAKGLGPIGSAIECLAGQPPP